MANDIVVQDSPSIDTLKYISGEDVGDQNTPFQENQSESDNERVARTKPESDDEPEIKLEGTEDSPEIKDDDIDFSPAITKKALVKEFPEILKKFPQLENTIYRERAFSELFPSIADAKNTIERAATLQNTESLIAQGNIEPILDSIKSDDKEAFYRIVDSFLPTLNKIDPGAYSNVIGNVGKYYIKRLLDVAKNFGLESDTGKHVQESARILNQLIFGDNNLRDYTQLAKPISDADKKLTEKEQEFNQQRFNDVQSELSARATNAIKSTISQYIDPKESMTPYVRDKAIEECGSLLDSAIKNDDIFISRINKLWEVAAQSNYSRDSQEKIKTAYYNKAQSLLPDIIKSVRAKALNGLNVSKRARKVEDDEDDNPRVGARPNETNKENGRSTSNKSGSNDGPKRGESTKDWLNRTLS